MKAYKHNKLTFTAEYCRARRIPYRIKNEALFIDGKQVCFSLYNLPYAEIVTVVDKFVVYDEYGDYVSNADSLSYTCNNSELLSDLAIEQKEQM